MNRLQNDWKVFARVLKVDYEEYKRGNLNFNIIADLEDEDEKFSAVENLKDPALDAAWNFVDTFFFSVEHKMESISDRFNNELTIQHSEELIEYILERVEQDLPIENPEILNFYGMTKPSATLKTCEAIAGFFSRLWNRKKKES